MSVNQSNSPYRNFRFQVEIDNIVKAGFADANIPDAAGRPVRFGEGKELSSTRRTPIQKRGVVTLKQGILTHRCFWAGANS